MVAGCVVFGSDLCYYDVDTIRVFHFSQQKNNIMVPPLADSVVSPASF